MMNVVELDTEGDEGKGPPNSEESRTVEAGIDHTFALACHAVRGIDLVLQMEEGQANYPRKPAPNAVQYCNPQAEGDTKAHGDSVTGEELD